MRLNLKKEPKEAIRAKLTLGRNSSGAPWAEGCRLVALWLAKHVRDDVLWAIYLSADGSDIGAAVISNGIKALGPEELWTWMTRIRDLFTNTALDLPNPSYLGVPSTLAVLTSLAPVASVHPTPCTTFEDALLAVATKGPGRKGASIAVLVHLFNSLPDVESSTGAKPVPHTIMAMLDAAVRAASTAESPTGPSSSKDAGTGSSVRVSGSSAKTASRDLFKTPGQSTASGGPVSARVL